MHLTYVALHEVTWYILHGVTERAETAAVSRGTSHVSAGHFGGHSEKRYKKLVTRMQSRGFQARTKDQEILEEGGGAGPLNLPRRDHE